MRGEHIKTDLFTWIILICFIADYKCYFARFAKLVEQKFRSNFWRNEVIIHSIIWYEPKQKNITSSDYLVRDWMRKKAVRAAVVPIMFSYWLHWLQVFGCVQMYQFSIISYDDFQRFQLAQWRHLIGREKNHTILVSSVSKRKRRDEEGKWKKSWQRWKVIPTLRIFITNPF